jgi:hypothetical protein
MNETASATRRRWAQAALGLVGLALIVLPAALGMFGRAPQGAAMLADFRPFMTPERLDGFQRDIADIDAAVREVSERAPAELTGGDRAEFEARYPAFTAFERTWVGIEHDMSELLDTIDGNVGNYRAVDGLPSFTLFPWFFAVPGALVLLGALAALVRARWWRGIRWGLMAVGAALLIAPAAFGMFDRAPKGGRMMEAFRGIETRPRIQAMQGYFGTMASGEGAIRVRIVPDLRRAGLSQEELDRRFSATVALGERWVGIVGGFTPMIGAMVDNLPRYRALAGLPPFALFPWFFALPGALIVALSAAAGPRLRAPGRARLGAARRPLTKGAK